MQLYGYPDSPPRKTLRGLLREQDLVVAGGAWDGITAVLAEHVGLDAVASGGWQISSSVGLPDANLYSKTHNLEAIRRIASRTRAAIIADMEDGYGNPAHVHYAVQEFERAGASAVSVEDQITPVMSCNHIGGFTREVYDLPIAVAKIRAAVEGKLDPETIVIARTDAEGDEILRRADAFAEVGADIMFATSPALGLDGLRRLHDSCGLPLMTFINPGSPQDRELSYDDIQGSGVRLLALSLHAFNAATTAIRTVFEQIKSRQPFAEMAPGAMVLEEWAEMIGIYEVLAMQEKYLGSPAPAA
jgi:methylisocitrate lyase